jgi:hypothetical protein
MNEYQKKGFSNRRHYLCHIAKELNVEQSVVFRIAFASPKEEDFDILVDKIKKVAE